MIGDTTPGTDQLAIKIVTGVAVHVLAPPQVAFYLSTSIFSSKSLSGALALSLCKIEDLKSLVGNMNA